MVKSGQKRPSKAVLAEAARVCACTNFRKATRVVTRLFDESLEPCGLRGTQLAMLLEISLNDQTTVPRLARSLVAEVSTVSRNLQPLIKRGLVSARRGRGQRSNRLGLTSQGWEALEKAVPYWESAQTSFVKAIGSQSWHRLLADLSRVTGGQHIDVLNKPRNGRQDLPG